MDGLLLVSSKEEKRAVARSQGNGKFPEMNILNRLLQFCLNLLQKCSNAMFSILLVYYDRGIVIEF